jgi:hypothetical protein
MTGYPGVSFLDGLAAQIGVPVQRTGAAYSQVTLAPHASAFAVLAVPDPDVRGCRTAPAHYVRIYPPNETRPSLVQVDSLEGGIVNGIRVCSQQVPGTINPVVTHSMNRTRLRPADFARGPVVAVAAKSAIEQSNRRSRPKRSGERALQDGRRRIRSCHSGTPGFARRSDIGPEQASY